MENKMSDKEIISILIIIIYLLIGTVFSFWAEVYETKETYGKTLVDNTLNWLIVSIFWPLLIIMTFFMSFEDWLKSPVNKGE